MSLRKNLFFLFLIIVQCLLAEAQDSTGVQLRPKVGVVLSGGGALGFAHVGVLKVLEEVGMPIDYIGGTSMGSIIGGLYAVGYSADSLSKLIAAQNWTNLLGDRIDRQYLSFEEKEHDGKLFIPYPISNGRFKLPSSLISGNNLEMLLSELFWNHLTDTNFLKLPKPFLCVATNLEKCEATVFTSGYLPKAIRASMAIPTVFEPVRMNGQLYVDGGIYNNFPVDEVKKLGADIIIGVDVGFEPFKGKDLESMFRIIEQSIFIHTIDKNNERRSMCDVLITLHVPDLNMMSFDQADTIIRMGEAEARKQYDRLKALADSLRNFKVMPVAHDSMPLQAKPIYINRLRIEGNQTIPAGFILSRFDFSAPDTVYPWRINEGIKRLFGTHLFEKVGYRIENNVEGNVLIIELNERKSSVFTAGINYNSDYRASIFFNTAFPNLIIPGSKLSLDILLGENPKINADYFIYRGWKPNLGKLSGFWRFDFGLNFKTNHYTLPTYNNDILLATNGYTDISCALYGQTIFENAYAVGLGIQQEFIAQKADINPLNTQNTKYRLLNYFSYLKFDTYDRTYFPSKGVNIYGEIKYITSPFLSEKLKPAVVLSGKYKIAIPVKEKVTLLCHVYSGLSFADSLPSNYSYRLGGVFTYYVKNAFPFYGYNLLEIDSKNALAGAGGIQVEIFKKNFATFYFNAARYNDNLTSLITQNNTIYGYAFSWGYNSIIGPIEFIVSKSHDRDLQLFFNVGFWF